MGIRAPIVGAFGHVVERMDTVLGQGTTLVLAAQTANGVGEIRPHSISPKGEDCEGVE